MSDTKQKQCWVAKLTSCGVFTYTHPLTHTPAVCWQMWFHCCCFSLRLSRVILPLKHFSKIELKAENSLWWECVFLQQQQQQKKKHLSFSSKNVIVSIVDLCFSPYVHWNMDRQHLSRKGKKVIAQNSHKTNIDWTGIWNHSATWCDF